MKSTHLSVLVGLLLAVVIPVALSVQCYQCYGEDVSVDSEDKGDLSCVHDPTKSAVIECPTDYCGKIYWHGTAEGTTDGVDWKVDVEGAARGCDDSGDCTDGATLSYKNDAIGYPDITTHLHCSKGDLSNDASVLAPAVFLTAVVTALASWLAQ